MRRRAPRVRLDRPPLVQNYFHPRNVAARRAYTRGWFRIAGRVGAGAGGIAAFGLANLLSKVPALDTSPVNMPRSMPRSKSRSASRRASNTARMDSTRDRAGLTAESNFRGGAAVGDYAGYIQRQFVKRNLGGRPVSRRTRLLRVLNGMAQPLITRYQNLSAPNATNGKQTLNFALGAAGSNNIYPVYLFDLTSSANLVARTVAAGVYTDTITYPNVLYRLNRARDAVSSLDNLNNYYFSPLNTTAGRLPDDSGACYTWTVEKKPMNNVWPMGRTYFDWVDLRFMVYGPQGKPCRVKFQIVRFNEKFCPGGFGFSNTDGTITTVPVRIEGDLGRGATAVADEDGAREWNEYWSGYVDNLVSNPLNKRDAYNLQTKRSPMRVLATELIDFNPTATYENDSRGHMKLMRMFKRFNKLVNYQWERKNAVSKPATGTNNTVTGIAPSNENNPNVWDSEGYRFTDVDGVGHQPWPRQAARLFLLISAESPVEGAFDPVSHASFDFCVRRKQTVAANTP